MMVSPNTPHERGLAGALVGKVGRSSLALAVALAPPPREPLPTLERMLRSPRATPRRLRASPTRFRRRAAKRWRSRPMSVIRRLSRGSSREHWTPMGGWTPPSTTPLVAGDRQPHSPRSPSKTTTALWRSTCVASFSP